MSDALSAPGRKKRLQACERVLVEHMEEFVKVGLALKEIRDDRLYREDGFDTFEAYCRKRWDLGRRHADQLIGSAEIRIKLTDMRSTGSQTESPTWTERTVRELKRLGTPEKAKAVAARVLKEVEQDGGKLTSTVVRKHVDKELGVKRGGPPKPEPKIDLFEHLWQWSGKLKGIAAGLNQIPSEELARVQASSVDRSKLKALVASIEELQESLTRVWEHLP